MSRYAITYISRFLISFFLSAPLFQTYHMVFVEHPGLDKVQGYQFGELTTGHLCQHYLPGEYKGWLFFASKEKTPVPLVSKKPEILEYRISLYPGDTITYYLRGPPVNPDCKV
ncbi:hypothetical protein [Autumnicola musiva]|uniref:Uncharacterized protein n=1 Tax=Autumnicola musiva TaxID=3075589 RepID=A0ABU3D6N5_9FLAO|nr:hypothetical protein [Zunongwangia sp. F117]MDT0677169.1 hypothetical protein [Zunongwangia sp. F117]